MLQPLALRRRCRAGEQLEPRIELQRVGRHRDGAFALAAQQLRQLERDVGLAHAGGPEQGDERQRSHGAQDRRRRARGR
jgi:hypothetical protein